MIYEAIRASNGKSVEVKIETLEDLKAFVKKEGNLILFKKDDDEDGFDIWIYDSYIE